MSAATEQPIKVAVAGPTGTLGPPILKGLLESTTPPFTITLLIRDTSIDKTKTMLNDLPTTTSTSSIKLTPLTDTDYLSPTALATHLANQDVLIDLLNRDRNAQSIALITAAVSSKLKHIIPSSYGLGHTHPYVRSMPPAQGKMAMETHLFSLCDAAATQHGLGNATTYTSINTGMFLEYALSIGLLLNTTPRMGGATLVPDDGTPVLNVCSMPDIATATVSAAVLGAQRDERVLNKEMYIRSFETSQNTLFGYAREIAPRKEWKVISIDSRQAEAESQRKFEQGDTSPDALRGFLVRASFGLGAGRFDDGKCRVANEVLGVTPWGEERVKAVVGELVRKAESGEKEVS